MRYLLTSIKTYSEPSKALVVLELKKNISQTNLSMHLNLEFYNVINMPQFYDKQFKTRNFQACVYVFHVMDYIFENVKKKKKTLDILTAC